ncbi:MAG: hypothetical protein KIS92_08635 [Planctomycetota bacterium]|nr:hypothetical protein [Planctomycetota bacterium]
MDHIYGRLFRLQEADQPLWRRACSWVLAGVLLAACGAWIFYAGRQVATAYRSLPAGVQMPIGRLAACLAGLQFFFHAARFWTQQLFHQGPMRDLALTPGSAAQILRVGLRLNLRDARLPWLAASVLYLAPWLWHECITFGVTPGWTWMLPLAWPLALILSTVLVLVGRAMVEACALAACMLGSALGVGGLAPRYPLLGRMLLGLHATLSIGGLAGIILAVASVFLAPGERASDLQRIGAAILEVAAEPSHPLHPLLRWSPSTFWFDAYAHTINGPYGQATFALLGCAATILAALGLTALCLPAGFSAEARLGFSGVSRDPKPAQAADAPTRAFDPDAENGPVEGWLLRKLGRMARATLRLMTRNHEAGSLDRHFLRTLYYAPVSLAAGWLALHLVPGAVDFVCRIWWQPLLPRDYRILGEGAAAVAILIVYVTRMSIWGRLTGAGLQGPQRSAAAPTGWALLAGQRAAPALSRGDLRIPLNELYAVGYSDAVLLPTLYALLWSFLLAGLALAEAVAVGLDPAASLLAAAIVAVVVPQTVFLIALLGIQSYCKNYRRTWTALILQTCAFAVVFISLISGILIVVAYLVQHVLDENRPVWIAYVGSVNLVLVFDVAVYMLARLVYVRRRFDAELPAVR